LFLKKNNFLRGQILSSSILEEKKKKKKKVFRRSRAFFRSQSVQTHTFILTLVSRGEDEEDDDRLPLVEHQHNGGDGVAVDVDAVHALDERANGATADDDASSEADTSTSRATTSSTRAWCCSTSRALSRVQPRVLRGRKRVLLSTASFIALLTLYYTYVLPALWHCSEYFTLMLMLGIVEGLLLFFAAIWHAYTSKHSARRAAHQRSAAKGAAADDEYNSETFSERSDYFDSEGGTSSAVEMSDALVDSAPLPLDSSAPAPIKPKHTRVKRLANSLPDDVDSSDGGIAPPSPLPPPRGRRTRVRRKRAPPRRRPSSDFDSENAESDDLDDEVDDDDDDEIDDDVPRPLAASTGSESSPSRPKKQRGIWRRCVALRARSISFNFCLTCFGIVNACVILFLVSAVFYIRDFTLPSVSGELKVPGLLARTTVQRDNNGVIHVRAENEHDLFFAQGFVSAQDRLFQIEFQRRLGAGRLSERLGNATISLDRYFRTLGLRRAAELAWPTLNQQTRDGVTAFADGVNAFLASQPPLPIEFRLLEYTRQDIEPFTALDVVQWSKVMAYDLSMNMHDELERFELAQNVSAERMAQFYPDYDTTAFPTVTDADDLKEDLLAKHVAQVRAMFQTHQLRRRNEGEQSISPDAVAAAVVSSDGKSSPADVAARVMGTDEVLEAPNVAHLEGLLSRYAGWRRGARASNNWAVHGVHTRSGRPLLANDPHLSFSTPAIWLLMHLQSPTINTIGAAFPSSPGVILGRNDHIAWGVTNVGTDVQDLYLLDTINRTAYRHNGEVRTFTLRNETILVKRPLLLLKPYEIELVVRESVHGPVVSDHVTIKGADARDLALRWSALDATDSSMNAFNGVMRAQNWTAFREAVALLSTPASNFVYADVAGNIGYQTTGVVPVRVAAHDGRMPISGNGSFDWLGYAPFDTLPSVLNPASGYVVSANNRVSPASFDAGLILNNGDWSPGFRARRITEMLHQHRRLTVDDMKTMQMDRQSGLFDDLAPLIAGLLQSNLFSDRERDWLTRLAHWDGALHADSHEGTVFLAWVEQLLDSASSELGVGRRPSILFVHYTFGRLVDGALPYDPVCLDDLPPALRTASSRTAAPLPVNGTETSGSNSTAEVYSDACVRFAARAFGRALLQLYDNWSDVVALGKRQQVVFEHEILKDTQLGCFYARHSDIGGDPWTVNPSGGVLHGTVGSVRKAVHGASYRQVVDFSDFSQSVFMSTIGQGEQPMSPFFDTYLERWLTGAYNPMMQEGIYSSLQLVPAETSTEL
jgi:penicillin amidase